MNRPLLLPASLLLPAILLMGAVAAPDASAQNSTAPGRLYQLAKDSIFQEGCFDPCLCPVVYLRPLVGTFILTPAGFDGLYRNYAVTHVKWMAEFGAYDRTFIGSGTYRVGGEFAVMQQLSLDLEREDGTLQHFDSGLVPGGGTFPAIDITVSRNGMVCYDTALHVKAWPAMRVDVSRDAITWEPARDATCYDVVMGDLRALHDGLGDYAASAARCLGNDVAGAGIPFGADPPPGEAYWFLVRGVDGLTDGAFDGGEESQVGTRDAGIAASPSACP